MIINLKATFWNGKEKVSEFEDEVEVTSSWYTGQNYFDQTLKDDLLSTDEYDTVILKWQNKNYVFKRK